MGVWYQGEANSFWNTDKYSCTLHQLVKSYRSQWSQSSDTAAHFPVGVVQLAAMANPPSEKKNDGEYFPLIRWHQSLDQGFLPNKFDYNMFLAVALDTYYNGSVHSHYKTLPGKRLGIAGLNVAYKMRDFPSKGPFPTDFRIFKTYEIERVEITYDEDAIFYSPIENSGFFYCCSSNSSFGCNGDEVTPASMWKLLPESRVSQVDDNKILVEVETCEGPSSIAYLWAESPVTALHGLPIYSINDFGLPANPWWKQL